MTKKNLIAALSAALVVGATGSVFAAPVVTLKGSVEGNLNYQQKATGTVEAGDYVADGIRGNQVIKLNTELNAGENVKGVIVFKAHEKDSALGVSTPQDIAVGVDKAYLQTTGAWWNGGQAVTTTLGDFDALYSPYMANVSGKEGIKVDGVKVGPMTASAFYGMKTWHNEVTGQDAEGNDITTKVDDDAAVYGAQLNTKVAGLDITGTGLRQGTESSAHGKIAFSPLKGVNMSADYAMTQPVSGAKIDDAMYLDAKAQVLPMLTLRGSYRDFDDNFAPKYMEHDTDDNVTTFIEENQKETGIHAGADLKIANVNTSVDYDQRLDKVDAGTPENTLEGKANTTVAGFTLDGRVKAADLKYSDSTFSVAKELPVLGHKFATSYALDHFAGERVLRHTAKASTAMNVLALQNVGLSGEVVYGSDKHVDAKKLSYSVSSTYTAPNGFALGAGYSSDKGVNASAGMKLEF